jgi:AraC family transcriptional regulator
LKQEPRIEISVEKKLIGKRARMNLAENKTFELWQSFMLRKKEIRNNISTDLFSIQVYEPNLNFRDFTPLTEFDKWATTEVTDLNAVPEGMETFILPGGLYAVFHYKGAPKDFTPTFQYIFGTWLPNSLYDLDARPHFEILGSKYTGNSSDSEEEIWVPIKIKTGPFSDFVCKS